MALRRVGVAPAANATESVEETELRSRWRRDSAARFLRHNERTMRASQPDTGGSTKGDLMRRAVSSFQVPPLCCFCPFHIKSVYPPGLTVSAAALPARW
eukprot:3333880-Pleurochrysis_carterae.AAC.2